MITKNGVQYVIKGSNEDNGTYTHYYYTDNIVETYNIMYDGEKVPLATPVSISNQYSVNVYSRAPQVRLYLNGTLLDTKATSNTFWAGFKVDYAPGVLRAVEYDGVNEGAAFELRTCGTPQSIRLKVDRSTILPDGADVAFVTAELIDAEGNVVHDYTRRITFTGTGAAILKATGNANPTDMASFLSPSPTLYDGRAMAIVQSGLTEGTYTLTASCPGFPDATATIVIRK